MRILLGVDRNDDTGALNLVKRLRFRHAAVDLAMVVPTFPIVTFASPDQFMLTHVDIETIESNENVQANATLSAAAAELGNECGKSATHVLHGNPTDRLMQHADATDADLIAVNAPHQTALFAFLTGSVARGLVIGARQSVLLARGNDDQHTERDASRPVRAVLATDHSPYMNQCIERLLQFAPLGLEQVTVLSCYPKHDLDGLRPYLSHLAVDPSEALRRDMEEKNQEVIGRLCEAIRPATVTVTSRVSGEPVNDAISQTMHDTRADLLIVGAQGHSFLDRLSLGSVSFHQAMTAPYSVLVLRVSETETAQIRAASAEAVTRRVLAG